MTTPQTPELFTIKLEPSGQQCDAWATDTLLDSIEMGGLQWPSSCRNGTCRTCLGTITSGSVRYEIDWPGLTPEEKAEGCVLPCVAYPNGDVSLQDPAN
ncbi:2Fe-2S iron-sulfur cluster-binding protein [Comamonas sp. NoAH]|uniref:2Fe-2S iron-sulfur cluster-binding protein n=1 Tax=Comamonas halotolerans TaxID=3041496 RepID=UPI0024E04BD1|nr:2Fe-2S iron-sulfur cluster-binding protein [Comamonas sp. NoAH]